MSTNNNGIQVVSMETEEKDSVNFSFRNFISRCVKGWYWIAVSVALCLGLAAFYILRTNPSYKRSASVLIKEGTVRRMATNDIESMLSMSSSGGMSSKVVNEAIAFESPALMQDVVSRLGLTTSYYFQGLFRDYVIYNTQVPIEASVEGLPGAASLTFRVSKRPDGGITVSKALYRYRREKTKFADMSAHFGDTLTLGPATVVITPCEYFTDEWKKPVIVNQSSLSAMTAVCSSKLKVEALDVKNRSDVLSLLYTDTSVQRADDVINTLINIYNEKWVEDRNKMAVATTQFISNRLSSLEVELRDVDENISDFKSRNLISDKDVASNFFLSQSLENSKNLQGAANNILSFRAMEAFLNENPGIETLIPLTASVSANNPVCTLVSEYNKIVLRRNSVRSNSSESNPLVQDLNQNLYDMRQAISASVKDQIANMESVIESYQQSETETKEKIADNPNKEKYLLSIGRQQKVKESLYLYLLQKREENELSQAFTAYNTRVLTPPMGLARPASPNAMRIGLLAFIFGLFAPIVFFYIQEISDTKVRRKSELEFLTLPFVGEVPQGVEKNKKDKNERNDIVVKPGKRDVLNEAIRIIRTNIEFLERGAKCPVIISCSFNPGSGKTFLSANISAALAIKGHRVLAIDGDLRKASLSEYVGSPKHGLTDYLAGTVSDVESLIKPLGSIDKMDILPVGSIPPNPSELISEPAFKEMIDAMKLKYDYIFIDCPPIDIVADTQIIAEQADRTLFILRSGVIDRKDVPNLQTFYDDNRFQKLCYIFNGVETSQSYYGHYGQSYGDKGDSYYGSSK